MSCIDMGSLHGSRLKDRLAVSPSPGGDFPPGLTMGDLPGVLARLDTVG